ncbi:exodeoxyribonuclease VII large subunit [Clostridium acetobutylicum]|uniref:exodeoxyribonuclease VII large subunit n=1 Tax=Clostridium TaxID=1485 RepID=UPI000200A6E4|nr:MULTISPECIES: exodeoxyribonuclease VII large subunit [Clostridium]ADZ21133.1 exodeoxyribonuclease VII large subunit [Clostridium acetobutylicum EA 2018]AEI34218.1 exodeoxyribonuclease VII large subunit [Clostridium acetobutylicum DSM 1731]AWV79531.1 exodeoxyribonuclease VII large subunit [Clostridium acetobutylicum]MBC2394495.1 exodeoxyribonuclease VII large subunit [Clostridium acetobutylicum]MBC2583457.1 exodeoxyribonuclease VII large subunit [Clostridium acetobutylicum]
MYIKVLSVSELNNYIKRVVDSDYILSNAQVKGEISNFKFHSSGHVYFSLKDEGGKINCIMFRSNAEKLKFIPENGMKVNVKGRVSVYVKDGAYQLYCTEITPEGRGELYEAFEKLKEKLLNEGMFSEEHKRNIPKYPKMIGVITSPTGAAIRDIINVATRRNKSVDMIICPTLVQGVNAPGELIKALDYLNNREDIDTIILARGGGSIEELWAFNDEKLAYAVYNSKKPVVTGVGHETDFTIVDFVSDRRAPTPSAAAEIAVPNINEEMNSFVSLKRALDTSIKTYIQNKCNQLEIAKRMLEKNSPEILIVNGYSSIDNFKYVLDMRIANKIKIEKEKILRYNSILKSNSPINILNKGYSIISDEIGNNISNVDKLKEQDKVHITFKDGKVNAKIDILR